MILTYFVEEVDKEEDEKITLTNLQGNENFHGNQKVFVW